MAESIEKNIVKRELSKVRWGQKVTLTEEDDFSIHEYTVNSKDTLRVHINEENLYFILVSGSAEFAFKEEKKVLFKGEKLDFIAKNESYDIIITNPGVIPLVLIKVNLK